MWLERRVPDASPYQIGNLVCAGPESLAAGKAELLREQVENGGDCGSSLVFCV